jgi:hypothetical protein
MAATNSSPASWDYQMGKLHWSRWRCQPWMGELRHVRHGRSQGAPSFRPHQVSRLPRPGFSRAVPGLRANLYQVWMVGLNVTRRPERG